LYADQGTTPRDPPPPRRAPRGVPRHPRQPQAAREDEPARRRSTQAPAARILRRLAGDRSAALPAVGRLGHAARGDRHRAFTGQANHHALRPGGASRAFLKRADWVEWNAKKPINSPIGAPNDTKTEKTRKKPVETQ